MSKKTGRYAIIEQFIADGMQYMFGNPGTVEQGFLDSVGEYGDLEYILSMQETIAVAMADGYARATKKPTVVQLHSGVGLGNGVGMMYQAKRGHAPLVIIAGEAGTQYDATDAQMAADLVAIAEPVTKWATRVIHPSSLLRVIRKAIKIAATPPMGPVFVSLPMDILDAPVEEEIFPSSFPSTRTVPPMEDIQAAAGMLASAQRPVIIMGDGIATSAAQDELESVATTLGAEVWGADCSEVNIRADFPLYKGQLGHMFGEHSQAITKTADAVLICGTYVFPEVFPVLSEPFDASAKIVHIDLNSYEIAKNFPVDLGFVADPKLTLAALSRSLASSMTETAKKAAAVRVEKATEDMAATLKNQLESDKARRDDVPMHPARFMEELAAALPEDAVIFDEALTSSPDLLRHIPPVKAGHFFQTRGGSLGVGFPGAIGLKLANPEKTVFSFAGDGGCMYTIQALWSAAHHGIGAKFVVCNNQSYMLLKLNIMQYWKERGIDEHKFPASFDLTDPVVDFAALSRSMGVPAARVERPEQIGPAIKEALETDGPFLIDLVISNEVPDPGPTEIVDNEGNGETMNIDVKNEFYWRQIEYLESFDIDGLMTHYHNDAVIVSFDFIVNGAENIRSHFKSYLEGLGSLEHKSVDNFTETGDTMFFEATVITDHGEARVYNAFVFRDEKIWRHFTGLLSFIPKATG